MLYLAIVSLIWAFSFGLIGSSLMGVDSFLVATLRLGCATLVFLPFVRMQSLDRRNRLRLFLCGAIQFGLMYVCYIKAYQYLPSHLVALFSILTPVYVVLIHDLRSRQFSMRYLLAALLSVAGAAAIEVQGVPSGSIWMGFALMQMAGLSFAFGQVAYRDWKLEHPAIHDRAVFAFLALGGTCSAGLCSLFFANPEALAINPAQWQAILYLGCVASGLGFFLWNKGASRSNPGTLAAFNNAVVPLAVLFSLFIFGEIEAVSAQALLRLAPGGCLMAGAVYVATQKKGS
ncbi:MAG: EamA family transporter [Opitutales bacterium]